MVSAETQALLLQFGAPRTQSIGVKRRGKPSSDRRNAGDTQNVPTGHL